jgi:hypothetical protein
VFVDVVAISRNRAFYRPKVAEPPIRSAQIRLYRAEAALNGPVTDRCVSFTRRFRAVRVRHASRQAVRGTAKFEPAAWSWAQMTSGSASGRSPKLPKRVFLSEEAITFELQRPYCGTWIAEPGSEPPPHSMLTTAQCDTHKPNERCCANIPTISFGVRCGFRPRPTHLNTPL